MTGVNKESRTEGKRLLIYIDNDIVVIDKKLLTNQMCSEFPDEDIIPAISEELRKYILKNNRIVEAIGIEKAESLEFDFQFVERRFGEKDPDCDKSQDVAWIEINLIIKNLPFEITYMSVVVSNTEFLTDMIPCTVYYDGIRYYQICSFDLSTVSSTSIKKINHNKSCEDAKGDIDDVFNEMHRKYGEEARSLEELFFDALIDSPFSIRV